MSAASNLCIVVLKRGVKFNILININHITCQLKSGSWGVGGLTGVKNVSWLSAVWICACPEMISLLTFSDIFADEESDIPWILSLRSNNTTQGAWWLTLWEFSKPMFESRVLLWDRVELRSHLAARDMKGVPNWTSSGQQWCHLLILSTWKCLGASDMSALLQHTSSHFLLGNGDWGPWSSMIKSPRGQCALSLKLPVAPDGLWFLLASGFGIINAHAEKSSWDKVH